jgi:hypothetical protein
MTSDYVQEIVIKQLKDFDAQTWIVDPLARAFVGSGDENSNSDMGLFLDTLDVIKYEANVENLIVAAHTGRALEHGIERARGASRFDDWADVRWILTKNDEGQRFLKAHGRDVDMEQHLLTYEAHSRQLGVDKAIRQTDATIEGIMEQIVKVVAEHPGLTTGQVKEKVSGGTDYINKAYNYTVGQGKIIAKQVGNSTTKIHYSPDHPAVSDRLEAL